MKRSEILCYNFPLIRNEGVGGSNPSCGTIFSEVRQ